MINILAYADDLVLLAPSWRALQQLLDKLSVAATSIDMLCNIKKTVCVYGLQPQTSVSGNIAALLRFLKLLNRQHAQTTDPSLSLQFSLELWSVLL